ncbi:MAG: molecular chaperone DnaJ [Chloroflexi bacterium]|nr:molecular chaperone DnaJ [Chloroflexota bacterium]
MNAQRDLYDLMGLPRDASQEDVKRAFRRLAMEYHPDRNKAADAEERFKEVAAAYEVLSDAERRSAYDRHGFAGVAGNGQGFEGFEGFEGFGGIFDAFFRGTATRRAGPQRGSDLRTTITIDFKDAVFGAERELQFERVERCANCRGSGSMPDSRPASCPECHGAGEVRRVQQSLFGQFVNIATCERCGGEGEIITDPCGACRGRGHRRVTVKRIVQVPGGVDDGAQIRVSGEGDGGSRGGPSGNLYVLLRVRPHPQFTRDGTDLVHELPVNIAQAALGATLEVPTIDGDPVLLEIEAGAQPGQVFTVRGRGVPHLRGSGRGDLLVRLTVETPTRLTAEQRALFEQLGESFGTPVASDDGDSGGSLFGRIRDALGG